MHVNFIFWANVKEAFESEFGCVFVVFVIINFNSFLSMVRVKMIILFRVNLIYKCVIYNFAQVIFRVHH